MTLGDRLKTAILAVSTPFVVMGAFGVYAVISDSIFDWKRIGPYSVSCALDVRASHKSSINCSTYRRNTDGDGLVDEKYTECGWPGGPGGHVSHEDEPITEADHVLLSYLGSECRRLDRSQ